jgi:hypothetical protein
MGASFVKSWLSRATRSKQPLDGGSVLLVGLIALAPNPGTPWQSRVIGSGAGLLLDMSQIFFAGAWNVARGIRGAATRGKIAGRRPPGGLRFLEIPRRRDLRIADHYASRPLRRPRKTSLPNAEMPAEYDFSRPRRLGREAGSETNLSIRIPTEVPNT